MRRIVRLTESDLTRLVRRVIKEQEELPRRKKGILGHKGNWYDEMDRPVNPDEFEHDEEIEFGPDDYDDYINHTERDFFNNKWSFGMRGHKKQDIGPGKRYWDKYQQDGPITLRKKMSEQMDEDDNDGEVKIEEGGLVLVKNASSNTVQNVLEQLPEELKFLAIIDCESADFSNIDMCGFPELIFINLRGTENNLEENIDCDFNAKGNGMYDFGY